MAKQGAEVVAWAYEPEVVEDINTRHENRIFLPGVELPPNYHATSSMKEAVTGRDLILVVPPSHVLRRVMTEAAPFIPEGVPVVTASKGIENDSLMLMSDVLEEVFPENLHAQLAFLSGPSFAKELASGLPTAVSIASKNLPLATQVQEMMANSYFRTYATDDVVGVELGGALKNVMAIAAGACDGLGFGHNTLCALITRGLAEMNRLAVHLGANPLTLAGLAGMGDLVLTCTGGLSRNRMVGQKLGQGMTLEEITKDMKQVAEGVRTANSAYRLSQREGIDMPIVEQVYAVIYEDVPASRALHTLMSRPLRQE